jgi:hypothetical protein
LIEIDGLPYFGGDLNAGAKTKVKIDKRTGRVLKMTITLLNKNKLTIDFKKLKLDLKLKNIPQAALVVEDGVDVVVRFGGTTATLSSPATLVKTKATLAPVTGEVTLDEEM